MTVTTARRSEIVRTLQRMRSDTDHRPYEDALTDAIEIIEGRGVPFDELGKLPSARRTDPDTSHEFVLTIGEAHRRYLTVYAIGAEFGEKITESAWGMNFTPDEAAIAAGDEPGPGPRKRISELKRGGLLTDTGKRRLSALRRPQQVLTLTEHGSKEAEKMGLVRS